MIALDDALLLGIKPERVGLPHQRVDAAEQRRIGVDLVPVAGDLRRHFALDFEQSVVGMRAGQQMKRIADALQRPAAQFQRRDRIVEARRCGVGRDGGDLGLVLGQRARIGLPEMLGRDAVERRNPVGGGPGLEKRIVGRRVWVVSVIGRGLTKWQGQA